jgi:hypothetical protein
LLCNKITAAKSKVVKTGWPSLKTRLAESSEEKYDSKRAVFPMIIMRSQIYIPVKSQNKYA